MDSCPFCNHAFAGAVPNQCPRCGEQVRARGPSAIMNTDGAAVVQLGTRIVRRVKLALLAAAAIVVGLIAIAAWMASRGKPEPIVPEHSPQLNATPPIELSGLMHLPLRPNIVFAVQPGPLLAYAERTKQDPVALLTRNRVPASLLGTLAKAGITLQHIDHVVGGAYMPDKNEEVRLGFVLVLRQKPDEKTLLEAVKTTGLNVARASDTVWVFSLHEADVANPIPLAPELRTLIEERVPKDAAMWAASAGERWHEKPLVLLLGKDTAARLSQGRAAAFGYSFGETPTLRVAVRTTDAPSAEKLRSKFRELATGEFSLAAGQDDWAELTRPIEPAEAANTMKRMLE